MRLETAVCWNREITSEYKRTSSIPRANTGNETQGGIVSPRIWVPIEDVL